MRVILPELGPTWSKDLIVRGRSYGGGGGGVNFGGLLDFSSTFSEGHELTLNLPNV